MISSGCMPTIGIPLSIPIVAGMPPLTRIIDSNRDERAIFSGYGNPTPRLRIDHIAVVRVKTMSVDSGFKRDNRLFVTDSIPDLV